MSSPLVFIESGEGAVQPTLLNAANMAPAPSRTFTFGLAAIPTSVAAPLHAFVIVSLLTSLSHHASTHCITGPPTTCHPGSTPSMLSLAEVDLPLIFPLAFAVIVLMAASIPSDIPVVVTPYVTAGTSPVVATLMPALPPILFSRGARFFALSHLSFCIFLFAPPRVSVKSTPKLRVSFTTFMPLLPSFAVSPPFTFLVEPIATVFPPSPLDTSMCSFSSSS